MDTNKFKQIVLSIVSVLILSAYAMLGSRSSHGLVSLEGLFTAILVVLIFIGVKGARSVVFAPADDRQKIKDEIVSGRFPLVFRMFKYGMIFLIVLIGVYVVFAMSLGKFTMPHLSLERSWTNTLAIFSSNDQRTIDLFRFLFLAPFGAVILVGISLFFRFRRGGEFNSELIKLLLGCFIMIAAFVYPILLVMFIGLGIQ